MNYQYPGHFLPDQDPGQELGSPFGFFTVLLWNFPIQQVIWYAMIFGWLKAAEIIRNPFGNPMFAAWNHKDDFCLDMFDEIEFEIWKATKSLENQDTIPINEI